MAMQLAGALVARQPIRQKGAAALGITGFEKAVRPLMRAVGVAWIERERALDKPGSVGDRAGFDLRPAEIAQKPPILRPVRRQLFEQGKLRFMVVTPAAEPQES